MRSESAGTAENSLETSDSLQSRQRSFLDEVLTVKHRQIDPRRLNLWNYVNSFADSNWDRDFSICKRFSASPMKSTPRKVSCYISCVN